MENVRKYRYINLVTNNRRRKYLVSEHNYDTTKSISNKNEEKKVKVNKPTYLGLSILEIRKILMYEFCYGYIEPKYQ